MEHHDLGNWNKAESRRHCIGRDVRCRRDMLAVPVIFDSASLWIIQLIMSWDNMEYAAGAGKLNLKRR